MAKLEIHEKLYSVVILGDFNPAIFHPSWFAQNDLIAHQEIGDASDLTCTDEVSTFVLDDIHFQIERKKFGITTKDAAKAPSVRDLVVGSFTLLEHTPLTFLGLNLDMTVACDSQDAWHAIGHRLAPKDPWNDVMDSPGMIGVSMQGKRPESSSERISIRIHPVMDPENGVFVGVNQHYALKSESRRSISERNCEAMRILGADWTSFYNYAEKSAMKLLEVDNSSEAFSNAHS
ncbi:hypothetical protein AB1L30_03855 [Bremerella sp. JC817]|uniref:hypothetical protein n=1 Tax=Bremerella sp. JC817 TaxID=3231756 RepID=UPI003459CB7F